MNPLQLIINILKGLICFIFSLGLSVAIVLAIHIYNYSWLFLAVVVGVVLGFLGTKLFFKWINYENK